MLPIRKLVQLLQKFPSVSSALRTLYTDYRVHSLQPRQTPFGFRFAGNETMSSGEFERTEAELILRLVPDVDVFVDVGANVGFFTCLAHSLDAHVVAIEPLPGNFQFLIANLQENGWLDVEVFPVGVSDQPGLLSFYGAGVGASLVRGWAGKKTAPEQVLPLSTLDILLQGRFVEERLFVKIDVEGAEYDVLQGARSLLERRPAPIWMVEICLDKHHPSGRNPNFERTFELFFEHGYSAALVETPETIVGREQIQEWSSTGKLMQYNFLFRAD
jgi:FkbM family methyltransferase